MKSIAKLGMMCIVATVAFVSVAPAADVWKDKKPADWTPKQMDKFLTNSPWANTVQPASAPPSMDQGAAGTGGGWGGGGGRGGGGGGGMGGNMGGAMPIMTFQIRWLSAPIMREALKVAESDALNAAIQKYADNYYIVGVQMQVEGGGSANGPRAGGGRGAGMGGGGQSGAAGAGQGTPSGQGPSAQQTEEGRGRFEATLIQGAILKFGHQAVHPEKAQIVPCKSGVMTLYMFPRSLKLEDVDKSYLFEVTQWQSTTRASFSLKGFEEAPDKGL